MWGRLILSRCRVGNEPSDFPRKDDRFVSPLGCGHWGFVDPISSEKLLNSFDLVLTLDELVIVLSVTFCGHEVVYLVLRNSEVVPSSVVQVYR